MSQSAPSIDASTASAFPVQPPVPKNLIQKTHEEALEEILTQTQVPWGEIGYITYKRTYARPLDEGGQLKEEYGDTIRRVLKACRDQLGVGFTPEEELEAARLFMNLKCSVAGRFLWQLGTKTVERLGILSLQNCALTLVDDPVRPFVWAMDALMLGVGVGFSIESKHVNKIPPVVQSGKVFKVDFEVDLSEEWASNDARLESPGAARDLLEQKLGCEINSVEVIPDTREGWCYLLSLVLHSYFGLWEGPVRYTVAAIRPHGYPIRSFGGVASGPDILVDGIEKICGILDQCLGRKIKPIEAMDIMTIIGSIVVAGNIRRSAMISIGDSDDVEYLKAKRWDLGPVPNWRAMSNNSVVCSDTRNLPLEFWETYQQGEPYGLINLDLTRKCGRTGDTRYKDELVVGYNPCSEQGLEDKETCSLAEVFLSRCETKEEFLTAVKFLYRINKHALALPCHHPETEEVVHRNMRMGIGITGVLQATEEQLSWLPEVYEELRKYDEAYSYQNNFPVSKKLTTSKPSGTMSLLPGVTPGVHPSPAGPHYIRRMRIAAGSPMVDVLLDHGYEVEPQRLFDGSNDPTTVVASFPCKVPEGTPVAEQYNAIEQLEMVKRIQREWSDNGVSVTVYYRLEELPIIRAWLDENFTDNLKAVSFLLYSGHGFDQAPYETISREQYDEMVSRVRPIPAGAFDKHVIDEKDIVGGLEECAGGACPIK